MAYTIKTHYAEKAKVQTISNGKVINHRGFVEAQDWLTSRVMYLMDICKFDDYTLDHTDNVYVLRAYRSAGKPGTRGKAMNVTYVVTVVE